MNIALVIFGLLMAVAIGYCWGIIVERKRITNAGDITRFITTSSLNTTHRIPLYDSDEFDVSAMRCRNCGEITPHGYIGRRGVYVCKICRCETVGYRSD